MQHLHVNVNIHVCDFVQRRVVLPIIINDYSYMIACPLIRTNMHVHGGEGRTGLSWELWQVCLTEFPSEMPCAGESRSYESF